MSDIHQEIDRAQNFAGIKQLLHDVVNMIQDHDAKCCQQPVTQPQRVK